MTVLVGSDLDRTLIYSRSAVEAHGDGGRELRAVERYQGADASWLTAPAARALTEVAQRAVFVPVTTRTPAQLARVRLPGPPPAYAICANGGVLLTGGVPDRGWSDRTAEAVRAATPLRTVLSHAEQLLEPDWSRSLRDADGLFCYAVVDRDRLPPGVLAETAAWSLQHGWRVSLQGRKLYWVPAALTKSAALAEVAARVRAERTLAAGDSLLDADLLLAADEGIAARHGELVASAWTAPHVTVTAAAGVLAGEEIAAWLLARVDVSSAG